MAWTIRGDADVAVTTVGGVTYGLDDTLRTFASMNFASWRLDFERLGDDVFTYTIKTANAKGKGAIVPRDGQSIAVFHDGVRKFVGTVVKPMLGLDQLKVTVYGPWWWMKQIALSGQAVDATGGKADRTSYVLPTQNLKLSFRALINRAADMGVPMAKITDANVDDRIGAMYQFLKTTLSNVSFAAALTEVMGYVPDATAWFDYTAGLPALNIRRRQGLTGLNYTVGGNGPVRVEKADIYPRTDQQVRQVQMKFVKRQPITGLPRWATQNHGTVSTETHKRQVQIVTISGPETLELAPKNDFDSVKLKTAKAYVDTAALFELDPVLKKAKTDWGKFLGIIDSPLAHTGWHRILSGETAEWMRPAAPKGYGLKRRTIRVTTWFTGTYNGTAGLGKCAAYLKSIGRLKWKVGGSTSAPRTFELMADFEMDAINLSYPVQTIVRKPWDFDFIEPPAGLAEALRDAQNWIPWEGPVTIVRRDLDGTNLLPRKMNLSGSHPDHADMNAMIRKVTYDGKNRVLFELGAPAKLDLKTLVNKMRRNPQDNIVYLNQ